MRLVEENKTLVNFFRIFHLLKQVIQSNESIEIFSFGCWFESLFRIEELVHLLAERQASSIRQLHLASIKNSDPQTIASTKEENF